MFLAIVLMLLRFGHSSEAMGIIAASQAHDEERNESTCDAICRELKANAKPATACKMFSRALPHPKMGRTCGSKFREGHTVACQMVCSRITGGDGRSISPWMERLTHSACQEMSGHIPYPAVFNACQQGYSEGLMAATIAVSHRLGEQQVVCEAGLAKASDIGDLHQDAQSQALQPQDGEVEGELEGGVNTEDGAFSIGQGNAENGLEESREAWMEALETPAEYIDYTAVARERVIAARRRRGSELKRGPACPVCSG